MELIKTKFAEDNSDDTIAFIEDVSDTLDDYDNRLSSTTDWEAKYNELDESWKKKYKDRFFSKDEVSNEGSASAESLDDVEEENNEPKTYDDLFEVKE